MPPDPQTVDDEDYASSEDSDFAPDAIPEAADSDVSDSESESEAAQEVVQKPKSKPKKRKHGKVESKGTGVENAGDGEAQDVGFENSGDEEVVGQSLKKQRRRRKKTGSSDVELSDDEGAEGGFVRTRLMVAQALEEKKILATTAGSTIDVDALWANRDSWSINQAADITTTPTPAGEGLLKDDTNVQKPDTVMGGTSTPGPENTTDQEDTIMIQRTYNFAGKIHTDTKLVARDSAEAKLYLESQSSLKPLDARDFIPRRAPKKARRSVFEPIAEAIPQRADLHFGVNNSVRTGLGGTGVVAKKLNTVEKSKMDWAGFVDKEGIKDELETAGKAKGSYLDRKEFLARVESKREEEARRARLKTSTYSLT